MKRLLLALAAGSCTLSLGANPLITYYQKKESKILISDGYNGELIAQAQKAYAQSSLEEGEQSLQLYYNKHAPFISDIYQEIFFLYNVEQWIFLIIDEEQERFAKELQERIYKLKEMSKIIDPRSQN